MGGDVHHANPFDRVEPKTGVKPFGRLVEQVMTSEPYASARTVFWIVDNGSSHAGKASIQRLEGAWPNLRLIHLAIHASWLKQIELYFSIVATQSTYPQRLRLTRRARRPAAALRRALPTDRQTVPEWTFTRTHLDRLLARIETHKPQAELA